MSWLSELLQGIPLNAVLKERVALAEQKLKDMDGEHHSLKTEVATLAAENEALRTKVEAMELAAVVIEKPTVVSGCYRFDGDPKLYCPKCFDDKGKKRHTTNMIANLHTCSDCGTFFGP